MQVAFWAGAFESAVAAGRRASVDTVRGSYGRGRTIRANGAQRAGMVDRIETLPALLARVVREGGKQASVRPGPASQREIERERLRLSLHAPAAGEHGDPGKVERTRLRLEQGLLRATHVRVAPETWAGLRTEGFVGLMAPVLYGEASRGFGAGVKIETWW